MTYRRGLGMLRGMRACGWLVVSGAVGLASMLGGGGCSSGTETGNPSLSGTLAYRGFSSRPLDFGVGEGGSVATVKNAWFELGALSVSTTGACEVEAGEGFSVPALGIGDHAAGSHVSTPFTARPGSFCSVLVPFLRVPEARAANAPPELLGHALLLVGELADGTPFSIASDSPLVVELRAEAGGFAVSAAQQSALLAFDFATWLDGLELSTATRSEQRIDISSSSNSELLAAFESQLAAGIALYADRDADGELDPEPERWASGE